RHSRRLQSIVVTRLPRRRKRVSGFRAEGGRRAGELRRSDVVSLGGREPRESLEQGGTHRSAVGANERQAPLQVAPRFSEISLHPTDLAQEGHRRALLRVDFGRFLKIEAGRLKIAVDERLMTDVSEDSRNAGPIPT